ncbi:MAG: hypothetical protein IJ165_13820 [Proteobacteria bacterium]|nr:hypothetical protein [Pseudomonadota bacterium]
MTQKILNNCFKSLLFACLVTAAAGCSQAQLPVTRYPSFWNYETNYQSIAVTPAYNPWDRGAYEGVVGGALANDLASNGTYTVYDHSADNADQNTILQHVQATNEADLVLMTTITGYEVTDREETRYETVETKVFVVDENGRFVLDENGNRILDHIEYEEVPYPWFIREADASMSMSVYRASDATQIFSTNFSGSCYDDAGHPHELRSKNSMQKCAISDMTDGAITPLVPIRKTLSIDKDDVMKIAAESDKGWVTGKKFSVNVPQLLIEITLPKAARYNNFRIDIVPEGDDNASPLQNFDFTWENESMQFYVNAQDLLVSGKTDFIARFWRDKTLVFTKEIQFK